MDKHPIGDLMETTMQKIREMIDVNTIVGEPIVTADGVTLIPVSKVSFGFGGAGTDLPVKGKQPDERNPFGGGSGAGVNIIPVAFLIVKGDNVRIINIGPPATTTVDRVVDLVPDVMDKVSKLISKSKDKDKDKDKDKESDGQGD